jgi:hypothetical protein
MAEDNSYKAEGGSSLVETPPELIEETIKKVRFILQEHFPAYLDFGNGTFTLTRGSTQVMIIVRPFTKDEVCVECTSNVVTGAKITDDLMHFLLRKNAELHFGSFGLLFDDTITFSYSLAGMNLDPNELRTAMDSIAVIADHYDDIIVDLAGGKRASDLVENTVIE